ncbi:choice-of-anchor Q domain-containing protein [Marinicella sp. W31]|uniref:choice-of-anchor Q domain-containing protein n=1 Tax=Marinicella sp. W31 TaxID=3023713 RepID=UPI0037579302
MNIKTHFLTLLFVSIGLLLSVNGQAQTFSCESVQSGIWEDAANWANCDGLFPDTFSQSATIKSNHVITLGLETVNVFAVSLESDAELVVDDQFNSVSIITNSGAFNSELGQVTANAENLVINAQFNDVILGDIDGDTNLNLLAESTIAFHGDVGSVIPLQSINTSNFGAFIQFNNTISLNLNGSTDSTFIAGVFMQSGARVTFTHSGTGHLIFEGEISSTGTSPHHLNIIKDSSVVRFNDDVDIGQFNISGTGKAFVNGGMIRTVSAPFSSGEMVFNTPIVVSGDPTFIVDGNVGGMFFNADIEQSLELASASQITIDVETVAHLVRVGDGVSIGSLTVIGDGQLELNGDITSNGAQSYQVPVIQNENINYRSTTNLIEFTELVSSDNKIMDLSMAGDGFELSSLDVSGMGRVNIGGPGTSVLTADWITGTSEIRTLIINQTLTSVGTVRLEGASMTVIAPLVLDGGDLTIGGSSVNLARSVDRVGVSEKIIVDLADDNRRLSNGLQSVFNVPVEVDTGFFSPRRGQFNENISIRNTSQFQALGSDFDASVSILDQSVLLLASSSIGRTEMNALSYPSGLQKTVVSINGTNAVSEYGQITVQDGPVVVGGSLETEVFSPVTIGDEYIIIDNLSANPVVNSFSGLPEGALTGDGLFTISYAGGDGNDVVLTSACSSEIEVTYRGFPGSGANTLEQDVENACDGAVLTFSDEIGGPFIRVSNTIVVDKSLTFIGSGRPLRGPAMESMFNVTAGNTLTLNNIEIINTTGDGAILNQGVLNANNVYFANNTQTNLSPGGGGAILNLGEANITNGTFYQNDAERGGAIFNDSLGVMTITNSTFYENGHTDAIQGGAIHNYGTLDLINSTLVNSGGGNVSGNTIYNTGINATLMLQNTAIEATSALVECNNNNGASIVELNSFVDDGSCDATLFGFAGLGEWADEGGFAFTISPLASSQLIDAGDDAVCPDVDVLDTPRPQRFQCDIGAVEFVESDVPNLSAVALNGAPLQACDNRTDNVATEFEITFSEPMLNADDVLNYVLVFAGADLNFEAPFDTDNEIYTFDTLISDNHPQTPTINLSLNQMLVDGLYRIEVASIITDEFSNPLNMGNDALYPFRIDMNNLFMNGDFDNCNGVNIDKGWQYSTLDTRVSSVARGAIPGEFIPDSTDLFDSEHSGALRIFSLNNSTYYRLSQCNNLATVTPLKLDLTVRLDSFAPSADTRGGTSNSTILYQCEFWDSQDCMGSSLDLDFAVDNALDSSGQPINLSNTFSNIPADTVSVDCGVWILPSAANSFSTLIDGLKLQALDLIFADGFDQ